MATSTSPNLREEIPVDIIKGASENTMNDLFNSFESGEQRNAELVNKFFDQPYFYGEDSLINKFIEVKPDIKFDDIKDEGINLALLLYDNWTWEFNNRLNKITSEEIKKAFIKTIHDKVQAEIGTGAPYDHFDDPNECAIPGDSNVLVYFQKIIDYLNKKEGEKSGKKTINVLKKIIITNNDLNSLLPAGDQIPPLTNLSDSSIPENTKNDFDILLSFEIGKEADRTNNIAREFFGKIEGLFTNTFPAVNTIISENDKYKYDESKLGSEYEGKAQAITNNPNLSNTDKEKQINNLRWEYYIKYLKTKNAKIGNALEQLYNNNFDYSKLEDSVLKDYLDKVVDIRLRMLFDSGLKDVIKVNFGNLDEFKNFCKDLADPAKTNITINDVSQISGRTGPISIPVKKSKIEGEHPRLKDDINQFGSKEKSYDALPLRYEIKKSDIDNLDITIEDRIKLLNFLSRFEKEDKYVIEGKDIGMLIYLFFTLNNRFPITEFNGSDQTKLQELFGEATDLKGGKEGENKKDENKKSENEPGEKPENKEEGDEEYTAENFKEDIEKLGPGKFENGSEIWLPMGNSELPGGGYQWMKIKISNIDMKKGTFKGTISGGELKFSSKFEGKSKEFKMNKDFFESLNKISKDSKKIWLQPNPDKSDFNTFRDNLNNKLGTNKLSFPIEGVTRNGNKFMKKIIDEKGKEKEVEVNYFGASADDKSSYKIEYNPTKKSFTVSSTFNGEEKGKDGKSEKKRFSYKRDMDWNNFLIFFTQKGLIPQSEEEANKANEKQDQEFKVMNGGHRKIQWFSINNIKHGFKDIIGGLKKKIDDYNKKQDEKFKKTVESPIINALASFPLLPASLKSAIGERQQEIYNEEFNGARKEIELYLKALQSDDKFADTFDQVPPHIQTLYGKSYQAFILNLYEKGDNISTEDKRKAAALLLANIEKGGSPFRGLAKYENKGLWVKILLGKEHHAQFMRDKEKLIKARDNAERLGSGDKKGFNEKLAAGELKYILNNIRGSYGGLIDGSYEKRGIPGEADTNYIDNPSKRLYSEQFANKLEAGYKGRFNKGTVEEKYSKFKSNNSFDEMENEFGKASSTRYQTGEAALRRMIDLATNDGLVNRMKKCFLTYLLSGALDINCDPGLKKQVYERAKPMMFVPGLLVKTAGVAENIAILLDDATGDFYSKVTKYFRKNKQLDGSTDFKGLQAEINNWLTDEKMKQLDEYFGNLPTKDLSKYTEPKLKVLSNYQKAMSDSNRDEQDRGILENSKVVSNGLLSSVEVVQKRINIKNGEFNGKDIDENNNMKEFREKVTKDINSRTTEPRQVAFVLEKFFNRFGIDNQQTYEWILTADHYKKHQGPFLLPYKEGVELNMGNIGKREIDSILWYAFQGNARRSRGLGCDRLPDELFDTLEAFRNYFSKAFDEGNLLDNYVVKNAFKPKTEETSPLLMGSRDVYDQAFAGDGELQRMDTSTSEEDLFGNDDNKKRKAKKNKTKELLKSSDFINSDIVNIEKQLKRNLGGTSGQFPSVTSSHSRTLREEYLSRLAA